AAGRRAAPATVALAWLIAQPTVAAPITSARSVEQLRPLLAAASLTLTPEELRLLDDASRPTPRHQPQDGPADGDSRRGQRDRRRQPQGATRPAATAAGSGGTGGGSRRERRDWRWQPRGAAGGVSGCGRSGSRRPRAGRRCPGG